MKVNASFLFFHKSSLLFVLLITLLLTSCKGIGGKLKMLEGNFYASRQINEQAINSYESAKRDSKIKPYAEYGIASVNLGMENIEQAIEIFDNAIADITNDSNQKIEDNKTLLYRLYYNKGIAYFEVNDYENAYNNFKTALEIDGSQIDAKRNLELALISKKQLEQRAGLLASEAEINPSNEPNAKSILFDYIRQMESTNFSGGTWTEDDEDYEGPDL